MYQLASHNLFILMSKRPLSGLDGYRAGFPIVEQIMRNSVDPLTPHMRRKQRHGSARTRKAVFFHQSIFLWIVLLCCVAFFVTRSSAQQTLTGQSGVSQARDVANFSELARKEALNPSVSSTVQTQASISPTTKSIPMLTQPSSVKSATVTSASLGAAPVASASFLALEDDNRKTLPSTQGAVGTNYLMVTLNSQVRIQDRSGNPISTITLGGWWNSFGASNLVDPRVLYDPYKQRWIFAALGDRETPLGLLLAVSQTSDPTGNWNRYFNSMTNALWIGVLMTGDSPKVGFNTNRIVVQVNEFDDTSKFAGSSIFAFN